MYGRVVVASSTNNLNNHNHHHTNKNSNYNNHNRNKKKGDIFNVTKAVDRKSISMQITARVFSAYLSHSIYFARIEEMSAFSLTPCSSASLSKASSKFLSIRIVLKTVFFLAFSSTINT
jgi:hypothetical protein